MGHRHVWGVDECIEGFFRGNLKVRGLSGDVDVGGRIMLKWILKRNREECRELDSSGSGQGDGNEPSSSIKFRFLNELRNC